MGLFTCSDLFCGPPLFFQHFKESLRILWHNMYAWMSIVWKKKKILEAVSLSTRERIVFLLFSYHR